MIKHRNVLIFVFILGLLFVAHRAKQYFDDRRMHNHDTYMVVKGGKYEKCPDLEMLGFKFSVMLTFMAVNLFFTVALIYETR